MSASLIASIRFKSLLIDFLFTAIRLSHGDDAPPLVPRGVCDHHHPPFEQAQTDKPLLSVVEAVVDKRDTRPVENAFGIPKVEPMFGDVRSVLGVIPFVFYFQV